MNSKIEEIMKEVHAANSCVSRNDYDKQTAILRKMIEKALNEKESELEKLIEKCNLLEKHITLAFHELNTGLCLAGEI